MEGDVSVGNGAVDNGSDGEGLQQVRNSINTRIYKNGLLLNLIILLLKLLN
jgi:hypothetical protein